MKKRILFIITTCVLFSLSACGQKKVEVKEDYIEEIQVDIEKEIEDAMNNYIPEPTATPIPEEIKALVPHISKNTDIDLSNIMINGQNINLENLTLLDVYEKIGLTVRDYGITNIKKQEFSFISPMFGLTEMGDAISIEILKDDKLIENNIDTSMLNSYLVKGIHFKNFFITNNELKISVCDISLNMSRDKMIEILGPGEIRGNSYYYNNDSFTLIIVTNIPIEPNENGLYEEYIDEIFLLKNN